MKEILKKILLIFVSLMIISCARGKVVIEESISEDVDAYDVDRDRLKSLKDAGIEEEEIDISYNEEGFVPLDIKYAKLTSKDKTIQRALDKINEYIRNDAETFKKENIETDIAEEVYREREFFGFTLDDTDIYVTNFDERYLSIRAFSYVDYMGAHPTYYISGYTFDRKTGEEIRLFDLIKDREEFRNYLMNWCEENDEEYMLFDEYKSVIDSYVDERPLYEDLSSEAPKLQFYFSDGVLCVIFQTYDIAPYAAGAISIDIPKELLK